MIRMMLWQLKSERPTLEESHCTSLYNQREYLRASGVQELLNSFWRRYDGDILDIRHP